MQCLPQRRGGPIDRLPAGPVAWRKPVLLVREALV